MAHHPRPIIHGIVPNAWGFEKFISEANQGEGLKFPRWARWYCTFGIPVIIIVIMGKGIWDKFAPMFA